MALTKVKGHIIADDLALGGNPTTSTQSASDNSTKIATTAYVTTAVSNLVDGAPSTLNTLNEIAAALNDDAALNTTLTTSIAAKLPLAGGTLTGTLIGTELNLNAAGDIHSTVNNSYMGLSGGTETNAGANIILYGQSHGSLANTSVFRSSGTERMRITSAGDILGKTADVRIGSDVGAIEYGTSTNNSTRFYTNDVERMRVQGGGNVGIGTSGPLGKLHVRDGSAQSGISHTYIYDGSAISIEATEPAIQLMAEDSGTHGGSLLWRYGNNAFAAIANPTTDAIDFTYGVTTNNDFQVHSGTNMSSYLKIMSIGADGNVGIGTDTPSSYFSGSNNLVVKQASGEGGITVVTADNTTGYLLFADGTVGNSAYRGQVAYLHGSDELYLVSSGNMVFKTDTSRITKATINTTGHLTFNPVSTFSGLNNSLLGSSNGYMYAMGGTAGLYLGDNSALSNAIGIRDANYIDFTTNGQNTLKFDLDGIHFQRADGQSITAKESIIMEIDEDNNSASRVFQVRDGSGSVLLNVHDDYRIAVGTLQYGTTTGAGSSQSNGLGASANDWVDVATIPYGRNVGTIFLWWDGVYSPASSHHGMMEFELASHYGTSYFYGWDTQLTLTRSTAHNSFYIKEARIITPGGSGATGYFQVKFGAATGTQGTFRVGMKSREESCSITPMTPAVNNSRSGTTLAFLEMQADQWSGKTGRVGHAFSKDVSIKGSLRVDGQPGCTVRGTGAWLDLTASTWNNFLQTPHVIYNSGSWNNTNKRFTAPCGGRYLITQSVYGRWDGSKTLGSGYLHVGFFINGTTSASNFGGSFPYQIHGYADTGSTPYYDGPAQTYIVDLSMGDYITPACYAHGSDNQSYEQYRYFSVQLLS